MDVRSVVTTPFQVAEGPPPDIFRGLLKAGAVALVIAAVMTLPVLLSPHPPTDPAQNREWAIQANDAAYRLGWTLQVFAVVPLIFGAVALFIALAGTAAARTALTGLLLTSLAGGVFLAGMAYPVIVMPAAGVVIGEGGEGPVLRLLDQIFREPAWIPIFFAALLYHVGWMVMGIAIWRSGVFPHWTGALVVAMGVIGIPAFLDVTALQLLSPVSMAAAALALAIGLWRRGAAFPAHAA